MQLKLIDALESSVTYVDSWKNCLVDAGRQKKLIQLYWRQNINWIKLPV